MASDFRPARKAHLAFAGADLGKLLKVLQTRGVKITTDDSPPGTRRFQAQDPWGSRLEFRESNLLERPPRAGDLQLFSKFSSLLGGFEDPS